MTILVTGGAGYIGSHIVQGLVDRQQPVVVLDNLSTGFRHAVPPEAPLIVGEVGDEGLVSRLLSEHRIEAVMHFAASSVVPDSVTNPLGYYSNNTVSSLALLKSVVAAGIKYFVFSSTAAVYGNPDNQLVAEDQIARPMSPYGASKLMTETMLRDIASASSLKYVILRYFNVAGADPKLRTGQSTRAATHLVKVAVQAALGIRAGMDIFGTDYPTPDGTCVRDYIHVCDLVSAHIEALAYLRGGGNSATLNCGYGHGYSVRDVVDTVRRISGTDFAVAERSRRAGDPASIVADTRAIRRVLSWTPAFDNLEAIVQHALAWERKLTAQNR
ncbi:MAG: UDP-glucose 4-epimerase GalE [Bradyrhizobium sp.]|uniref:UDP-glucose 4-epimerase GalE n=1 Tax=Bradyrhizobium sp. TaxID=376 RepID=UPI001C2A45C5|nr:UDP-glucose 4-epimerase GalE [Bradyrhizobium sp.]MBU6461145.1 UDP-glucose 4-epimerase GalE [Pseudomonadota bacterium]MDE2066221.1 UDP-glucose 4-epimerase GalE [Bradyrhizobium sp.]